MTILTSSESSAAEKFDNAMKPICEAYLKKPMTSLAALSKNEIRKIVFSRKGKIQG